MQAQEKLIKARSALVLDDPFFGSLVLRLSPVADPSCETMWTDGVSLGFNPDYVDSLPLDQLKGVLCHEVMHCALSHHARRGDRDSKKWNVAADFAVNPLIRDKYSLPEGLLFDPDYVGLSADDIFSRLPSGDPGDDSPQDGAGSGGDQGGGDPGEDEGDSSGGDPGGCGEVRDCPAPDGSQGSAADLARSESEWRVNVAQASNQAAAFGDLDAGMARVVDSIVNPVLDWRALLHRFIDQTVKSDYSWMRPNRRYIHAGLYLPSCGVPEIGSIVVAVDTSGSVSDSMLKSVCSEIRSIVQDFRCDVSVVYCDTSIKGVERFYDGDFPEKLDAQGGGGTRLDPVFDWVDSEGLCPSCLIYFTDLQAPCPESDPDYPVLWVVSGSEYGRCVPGFGEVIKV